MAWLSVAAAMPLSAAFRLLSASIRKFAATTTLSPSAMPLADSREAAALRAELDLARLETAFALVEDHDLARAGVDHRAVGHGDDGPAGARRDLDIGIHVGPQHARLDWRVRCAPSCVRVSLCRHADRSASTLPLKALARQAADADRRRLAQLHIGQVAVRTRPRAPRWSKVRRCGRGLARRTAACPRWRLRVSTTPSRGDGQVMVSGTCRVRSISAITRRLRRGSRGADGAPYRSHRRCDRPAGTALQDVHLGAVDCEQRLALADAVAGA